MNIAIILLIISTAVAISFIIFSTWQVKKNRRLEKLLSHTTQKLEHLQIHFGRFTPSEVIESLTDSAGQYKASMRMVTVLFADLNGFTKMCQDLDPEKVVAILNGYFRCMSEVISLHHGQVTELMGDGLLALFGALSNNPWQVQDAVKGALAMRKALEEYNSELFLKGLPSLSFGIGIHQGEVLAGVMGNLELSKFAVVGDPINTAARIESLTRQHQRDILITQEIADGLDERFVLEKLAPILVKGKTKPITTYFVQGMRNE